MIDISLQESPQVELKMPKETDVELALQKESDVVLQTGCLDTNVSIDVQPHSVEDIIDVSIATEIKGSTYDGQYIVTPASDRNIVLETKNKRLEDNVTVLKIPYYETGNEHGFTVYIASEVI